MFLFKQQFMPLFKSYICIDTLHKGELALQPSKQKIFFKLMRLPASSLVYQLTASHPHALK